LSQTCRLISFIVSRLGPLFGAENN
jgi:hypothetical protein